MEQNQKNAANGIKTILFLMPTANSGIKKGLTDPCHPGRSIKDPKKYRLDFSNEGPNERVWFRTYSDCSYSSTRSGNIGRGL